MKTRQILARLNLHLLIALALVPALHSSLLAFTFRNTYDAYVHIFFADHYARAWFDHWEYRWYTGFTMTSYPPASHQAMALLSKIANLQVAFIIVFSVGIFLLVLGIYRFSRIWVSEKAAGYAALFTVLASGITLTVHVFGQLPTIISLGFLLNALPFVYRWCRHGRWYSFWGALALIAAVTATHHVTTLFGLVFIIGPVMLVAVLDNLQALPAYKPAEWTRQAIWQKLLLFVQDAWPSFRRTIPFVAGLVCLLIVVVLPYWLWSSADPITQIPIPHASRDSFIEEPISGIFFWIIPYGMTLFILPYLLQTSVFNRRNWPLGLSFAFMVLLGTGGTTPIPRLILRDAFEILTLDRFTLWATVISLPFVGQFAYSFRKGDLKHYVQSRYGVSTWVGIQVAIVTGLILTTGLVATLTNYRKLQPAPINMQPIADFLEKDEHWRWRYLTLGFGDQMAWLSTQTKATSVDGNYHSARRLPELTTTPIERLEGAKFRGIAGIGSLQQFLTVPEKYHLKYVFSNDKFYDPLLYFSGWHRLGRLENGIMIWERADILPLPDVLPRKEIPIWQRVLWGTVPMTSLVIGSLALIANGLVKARKIGAWPAEEMPDRRLTAPLARRDALFAIWSTSAVTFVIFGVGLYLAGNWIVQALITTPESQLIAYYDELDRAGFEDSYDYLDPETRSDLATYIAQMTADGGLLASYAKLNTIRIERVFEDENMVELRAHTDWLTALEPYTTTQTHRMWKRDGKWGIEQADVELFTPPELFMRQADIGWELLTAIDQRETAASEYPNVPDRPDLEFLASRLVQVDGRYSLIGEVINVDVDPGDLTVTGIIFDGNNEKVISYNAQDAIIHKVLPKEVTPFRVDFEGVAAAELLGNRNQDTLAFDPHAYSLPDLDASVLARYEVYAKAVVTEHDLYRGLGVQNLEIVQTLEGYVLQGELVNVGVHRALVPRVLLSYYAPNGELMWVGDETVAHAVRPQQTLAFEVPLDTSAAVETILTLDDGAMYTNSAKPNLPENLSQENRNLRRITLPAGTGFGELGVAIYTLIDEYN